MQMKMLDPLTQQIILGSWRNVLNGFLIDRQSRSLSPRSIQFYRDELRYFTDFLDQLGVQIITEITADIIRKYLLHLSQTRNPGGCHAAYRAIRALCLWWEDETDGDYRAPIHKVKPPKKNKQPLPGIPLDSVQQMVKACKTNSQLAPRDTAVLLTLLDTGCRASELISLNIGDVDIITGAINILHGKGDKHRVVYIGKRTRLELRRYLKTRQELSQRSPLFTTDDNERLGFWGLRQIVRRRAKDAQIPEPGLHDFRRCFALNCLRNGMDLISLSRLLGHSSLTVTQGYIAQINDDLQAAHRKGSPVDRME